MAKILEIEELQKAQAYLKSTASIFVTLIAQKISHIRRMLMQIPGLYHWVSDRCVPSENNRVERELRPTVIARKVSFGSQSENGAATRSVLMSILHTAAKRLKNQSLEEWFLWTLEEFTKNPNVDPSFLLPP